MSLGEKNSESGGEIAKRLNKGMKVIKKKTQEIRLWERKPT